MAQQIVIGQDSDGNPVTTDPQTIAQAMQQIQGGGGGAQVNSLMGGFQLITGWLNADTASALEQDIGAQKETQKLNYDSISALLANNSIADPQVAKAIGYIQDWMEAQQNINSDEKKAIDLGRTSSLEQAVGGGLQLMGGLGGQGFLNVGGNLVPIALAGGAGYLLGQNSGSGSSGSRRNG